MSSKNLLELVMIVKNSGEILRKCLQSIKPFISKWTILDTGSLDNTPEIINQEMNGLDGFLFFDTFTDFSSSRNKSLDLACSNGIQCKYQIILDDSYVLVGGDELLKTLEKSESDAFSIFINTSKSGSMYYSLRIIKTQNNLRYKGKIHEYIDCSTSEFLSKYIYIKDIFTPNHSYRSKNRYEKDILLLKEELKRDENNQRFLFHLAKTYLFMENTEKCMKYLEKLKKIKNVEREYEFYSISTINYLNWIDKKGEYYKNDDMFIKKMFDLSKKFPERIVECLYNSVRILYDKSEFVKLLPLIKKLILFKEPELYLTDVPCYIYRYYIPYIYINTLLKCGEINGAVDKLKNLLNIYPEDQQLLNIKYALCDNFNIPIKLNAKVIVIHTGQFYREWNPKTDTEISGSEYMAINVANEFVKIGWRVLVFGNFLNEKNNFECVQKGVQCIDNSKFVNFYEKYYINVLIVSRFLQNLVYHDNIEKVFLWVHDIIPITDNYIFQTDPKKFKGAIVLSDWHKKKFQEETGIPDNYIILSRNAIYPERFLKTVTKVKHQFIYSAVYYRGLPKLIDMIQEIKKIFPDTTLKIFTEIEQLPVELLKKIKSLDYIKLSKRVSQEQISLEYLESDIWLYPTNFKETYCITALEAMCAGVLVACTGVAGLIDTVGNRGIIAKEPENKKEYDKMYDDLLKKLIFVMKNPELKTHYIEKAKDWAITQSFDSLIKDWLKFF
jgi:hypothetical protein